MKKLLIGAFFITASLYCFSQKTEFSGNECKIKVDSIYQHCNTKKAQSEVLKLCLSNPNNATSLKNLYYLKRNIGKEQLKRTLNSLDEINKSDIHAQSLNIYINTRQVIKGDRYFDFSATTSENENFLLSDVLKEKDVLLIFGGLNCMGKSSRQALRELYGKLDLNKVEVVSFLDVEKEDTLKEQIKKYDVNWVAIADYQGVLSNPWLAYVGKGVPTTVYINRKGEILVSRPGLVNKAIKLLKNHVKV